MAKKLTLEEARTLINGEKKPSTLAMIFGRLLAYGLISSMLLVMAAVIKWAWGTLF